MLKHRLHRTHRFRLLASNLEHKGETRLLPPSEWQRIPTELVEDVFDIFIVHFSGPATPRFYRRSIFQPALRTLACVSWHWYIMATEVLYEHIFVPSHIALGILATTMADCNNKHLPHLVQSLTMGAGVFESFRKIDQSDYDERIRYYQMICDACPSLTFVDRSRGRSDVGDIIDTNCVDISKLTHLDVLLAKNLLRNRPDRNSSCLGPIAALPAMQDLTIRVYEDEPTVHDVQSIEPDYVILPDMPHLRRLSVIGWDAPYNSYMAFGSIHEPSLRVLEFINCSIDSLHACRLPMRAAERLVITGSVRSSSCSSNGNFTFLPNLRYILLDGSINEDELASIESSVASFFDSTAALFSMAKYLMPYVQHVHIVSPDVVRKDKSTFRHDWNKAVEAARKANVTFTVGMEGLHQHKTSDMTALISPLPRRETRCKWWMGSRMADDTFMVFEH